MTKDTNKEKCICEIIREYKDGVKLRKTDPNCSIHGSQKGEEKQEALNADTARAMLGGGGSGSEKPVSENIGWEKRFDLLWGLAPKDSLKGKKGKEVKNFIRKTIEKSLDLQRVQHSRTMDVLIKDHIPNVDKLVSANTNDEITEISLQFVEMVIKITMSKNIKKTYWVNKFSKKIYEIIANKRRKVAEDICVLIDHLEARDENHSMEQWRNYKRIRNAIRDQYTK